MQYLHYAPRERDADLVAEAFDTTWRSANGQPRLVIDAAGA